MSVGVKLDMKNFFFDRKKLDRWLNAKERRALQTAGAYVRTRARSLIGKVRKRKSRRGKQAQMSQPGQPPTSWQSPGLRNIIYAYNRDKHNVAIGPVQFNSGDTTGLLEDGGTTQITESSVNGGEWVPGRLTKGDVKTRRRRAHYRPRPFMGPALQAEQKSIMDAFAKAKG